MKWLHSFFNKSDKVVESDKATEPHRQLFPEAEDLPKSLSYILNSLQPKHVLQALENNYQNYNYPDHKIVHEIYLDRTWHAPSKQECAELKARGERLQEYCLESPEFKAVINRLKQAGVQWEFGGQGDVCGEFNVLRLWAPVASLPLLKALTTQDRD